MRLSDKACKASPRASLEKRSDGAGLQLWVKASGSRLWRLAYRYQGKQKRLALGSYPLISLARARELRDEAKKLLAEGVEPRSHRLIRVWQKN
ncbi:MAG: Arm DNA-binding domain-containing protein [Rhizomicrobium sp.]